MLTYELIFAFAVAILVARIYGIGWLRQLLERVFGIGSQQQQSEVGHDEEEGFRGSSPSPRVSVSSQLEEIQSWCSDDTIDTGPPPSPAETTTHQDLASSSAAAAEMLTTAINVVVVSRGAS
ncbi:unnamed protein product [Urochloa humidicola]